MSLAQRSIQRYMIVGGALVVGVTFGIGGWAATSRISGAVIAQGVVAVASSVKKVQHSTGGIVSELRVRDGDRVKAGDILIRLDQTQVMASANVLTRSVDELLAREARLIAERDNADHIAFPKVLLDRIKDADSEAGAAVGAEQKLIDLRSQARNGQKAQLRERAVQLQDEIRGYLGQAEAKQKEVDLIHRELAGLQALYQKKLVPITRVTALERDTARLEGERSQLTGAIAQAKGKTAEVELQIIQIDQDLRAEVGKDLIETRAKLSEAAERKIAAVDQLNRIDIRAPQSGRVHQLSVHTVGGVVSPGEQIMLVVPDADALVVEARLAPYDINEVYVGQAATMRFTAFDQRITPEVQGEVAMVSADASQDTHTGASYFTARMELTSDVLTQLGGARLTAGMPVDVFIKTPPRTALSYLTKPLWDQFEHAMKER
ncbi:HlyD family secretion protein [Rhodoblastus sphagnicola]|nr:HlyD family type I secretion periplasmic adaptor subunit [Rhodoblastus sphagnicola]MBB4200388.1 HlyD family secretion protein [Rhodoblastus sphagnicola]